MKLWKIKLKNFKKNNSLIKEKIKINLKKMLKSKLKNLKKKIIN